MAAHQPAKRLERMLLRELHQLELPPALAHLTGRGTVLVHGLGTHHLCTVLASEHVGCSHAVGSIKDDAPAPSMAADEACVVRASVLGLTTRASGRARNRRKQARLVGCMARRLPRAR
jgi:hypothetical protein